MLKKYVVLFIVFSIWITAILSADLLDDLEKFGETNGKKYLEPFAEVLTTSMNTGWFSVAKGGMMHFGFCVNPMITIIPDDAKTFTASSPDTSLYEENEIESATVFGDKGGTFHGVIPGTYLTLPDGINLSTFPFLVPQAHIGLPSGIDVEIRFFPEVEISKDIGKFTYWGLGIKNQVSKFIPLCPVAIAVQGTYQQFSLGDYIEMNTTYFNVHASKSLVVVPLTVYGGVGVENSTLTAKYDYAGAIPGIDEIKFDIETESNMKITLGTRLKLLIFDLMADYSISKYNTFRLGVGASF
ncbi:MAG: DUF6588 family protein [Candidatus Cloacimonadota bacterium]|nr:DUF6588 family protein [Candidatus Cloacimonadota bacterium]